MGGRSAGANSQMSDWGNAVVRVRAAGSVIRP
jgi:hypothetical protein